MILTQILKKTLYVLPIVVGGTLIANKKAYNKQEYKQILTYPPYFPKRKELLEKLKSEDFDVIVIGGGATGAGVAYEANKRGYKVALVERGDFSSGTSSRSTKLIHGGVRYLQKAVFTLDYEEFKLVTEALNERKLLMSSCPNLVTPVPILLPCSSIFDFIYKGCGLLLYELISRDSSMFPKYASKKQIKEMFPYLDTENFFNGIIYFDGQHDDSRTNLTVIKTVNANGAVACNYVEVSNLLKNGSHITGARVVDKITGEEFDCKAKIIINATGPYTDAIRTMALPHCYRICKPSAGVHLSMPKYMTSSGVGLLLDEPNNRVLFILPWQNKTIVGTTDNQCSLADNPCPTKVEVEEILQRFSKIVNNKSLASINNVESCWSGIRPLVLDPHSTTKESASIPRTHIIEIHNNFLSILGGKWTTFRNMGKETVDEIQKLLSPPSSSIEVRYDFSLYGCEGWNRDLAKTLIKKYEMDEDIAEHLSTNYGTLAEQIISSSSLQNPLTRLHKSYPYTEEEILYICENEYVCTTEDILSRRIRLSFLDIEATRKVAPMIINILSTHFGWNEKKINEEFENVERFLNMEMGAALIGK